MKTCNKCKLDLPIEFFRTHPRAKDGRVKSCKRCAKPNKVKVKTAYEKLLEANPEQNVELFDDTGTEEIYRKSWAVPGYGGWQATYRAQQKYQAETGLNINEYKKTQQDITNLGHSIFYASNPENDGSYKRKKFKGNHEM